MRIASALLPGTSRPQFCLVSKAGDRVTPVDVDPGARGEAAGDLVRITAADLEGLGSRSIPIEDVLLVSPVRSPSKVVAIGRNYRAHAAEEGVAIPDEPMIFAKFPSAIIGPDASIIIDPRLTSSVDYEAELAVVIGKRARDVPEHAALDYVFGYVCLNDISARDLQASDGQWTRAKSLETYCPIGPWVVTRDEIEDPQDLRITCTVNGEVRQDASTGEMIFGVATLVSHLSRQFTLEPGDLIATGTPDGVGAFQDPPAFLADGDDVVVEISKIGRLVNTCRVIEHDGA